MPFLSRILGTEAPPPPKVRAEPRLAEPQAAALAAPEQKQVATTTDTAYSAPLLFGALGYFASNTGLAVTPATALTAPAVYACVKCLSEDLGKLPLVVRRRLPGGGWQPDPAHPLNQLFRAPNLWQTAFEWKSYAITSLCLRGNAYIVVLRDKMGRPRRLIPVSPDRVGVYLAPEGALYYGISHPLVGNGITVHQDDMIHVRGMSLDGYTGISPIAAMADAIGLSLATQQHGAVLFRQGAQVAGVLKYPAKLTEQGYARLKQSWQDAHAGVQQSFQTAILEDGVTFEKVSITSEEAQFLQTRTFQVQDVCRAFRVPPHKVMQAENITPGNVEQAEIVYMKDGLGPLATRLEQAMDAALLFEDEVAKYSVRFDFNELLRGDRLSRYNAYQIGLTNGVLSVNEARAEEGLPPIEGGDTHRVPLNTGAVSRVNPEGAAAVTAPQEPVPFSPPSQ